ncbi:hypothetical protein [Streptomyces sp. NPDC059271]|uniref:hypothetical protein n=1 Tax=Streptomyces sp. NPDC059271 TaxID=3346799 RepID=UPI0036ABF37E
MRASVETTIAPCTELIYKAGQFEESLKFFTQLYGGELTLGSAVGILQARFTDNDGRLWERTPKTLEDWPDLKSIPHTPPVVVDARPVKPEWEIGVTAANKTKVAASCEEKGS